MFSPITCSLCGNYCDTPMHELGCQGITKPQEHNAVYVLVSDDPFSEEMIPDYFLSFEKASKEADFLNGISVYGYKVARLHRSVLDS